jgi:hypothetical protein
MHVNKISLCTLSLIRTVEFTPYLSLLAIHPLQFSKEKHWIHISCYTSEASSFLFPLNSCFGKSKIMRRSMRYKMLRKVAKAELVKGDWITLYNISNYYLHIYNSATPKDTCGKHSMASHLYIFLILSLVPECSS